MPKTTVADALPRSLQPVCGREPQLSALYQSIVASSDERTACSAVGSSCRRNDLTATTAPTQCADVERITPDIAAPRGKHGA